MLTPEQAERRDWWRQRITVQEATGHGDSWLLPRARPEGKHRPVKMTSRVRPTSNLHQSAR